MKPDPSSEKGGGLNPSLVGAGIPDEEIYTKHKRVVATELRTRVMWFISLRWFVPFGIAGIGTLSWMLGFRFSLPAVFSVALFVLVYNLVFFLIGKRVDFNPRRLHRLYAFTYSQVSLDYLALFCLVHFSGGAVSPIIFVFIFHIIFAAILLPARSAFGFAAVAVVGMAAMAFGESVGLIAHKPILFRGESIDLFEKPWYVISLLFSFSGAIVATALSTTAVMGMLKRRIVENAEFYEQIENLTRDRWRFMRKVAHNLRAPLAAVISMLDMVRSEYLGPLEEQQVEYLRRVDRRARHMANLINELMAIARSRTQTALPSPHPISIPMLAGRISRTFRDEASQKGLLLRVEVEEGLSGIQTDIESAEPILENLISNAIKYTVQGEILVRFSSAGPSLLRITVKDTGIGIPEEEQPQLFREFFRAGNARTVEEVGTGLGLALVKETLDKNGGRIEFESRLNEGTTFNVFIPMSEDPEDVS